MARLNASQRRQVIRNATRELRRSGGRRSGSGEPGPLGGLFRTLGARFGPLGEVIGMLGDILSGGRRVTRRNIEDAVRILTEEGFEVAPAPPEAPPVIVQPPPVVPRGVRPAPAVPPASIPPLPPQEPADPWPAEHSVRILPRRVRGVYDSIPADIDTFQGWILTPQSSNVHAVAYHEGILYVWYRAAGKPTGYKDGISLCTGKAYKIGIRPDVPGPIYSYGGAGRPVPQSVFDAIATSRSPGKQVWDKLRVCGSQWQHQYVYTLTDVPMGQAVPRKATRRGLAVRNVPNVGLGPRGSRRSTLPARVAGIR